MRFSGAGGRGLEGFRALVRIRKRHQSSLIRLVGAQGEDCYPPSMKRVLSRN